MKAFIDNNRKIIFITVIVATFCCALAFFCLTPFLSDDYAYLMELRNNNAHSIFDVMKLAFGEYFEHGGRLVTYFSFRLFLLAPTKFFFNFFGSIYFVALGLLVYANVDRKKKYDISILLLSFGLIWLLSVEPGQTVFWLSGSVGYLFTTVYILGSVTLYRYFLKKDTLKRPCLMALVMFLVALIAGDCSENNSAVAILICAIVTLLKYTGEKKKSFLKPYMIGALAGYLAGYLILILSPGTWSRASATSEGDYTGFVGILSHIYKIMVSLRELFLPMLIVIAVLLTVLVLFKRFNSFREVLDNSAVLYIIGALAGSFVLAVIAPPMPRAYFGASIFLIISVINLVQEMRSIGDLKTMGTVIKYVAVVVMCLIFTFTYLENLVNLARIYRETNEQTAILEQAVAEGETRYVEIPQLHADFDNKYTIAYFPQIDPDPDFWINTFYEGWYGIEKVSAVLRERWDD